MPLFVVAYDLKVKDGESRDYGPIEKALENLDSCHTQESVWYVDRTGTAEELRNYLKPKILEKDWLMVVEFSKRPSWTYAKSGTLDWVKRKFGN